MNCLNAILIQEEALRRLKFNVKPAKGECLCL